MSPRRAAVCLIAVLVAGSLLAPGPVVGAEVSNPQSAADVASPVSHVAQQGTPTNNTTVRQEDPETVGEDGDLGQVQSNLARVLASRLGDSSIQISEGQYDRARRLLGDEYDRDLGKYVDVAGETGSEGTAETFQQASTRTREYGDAVESYRETREEYREARANGDTERARELARELRRDATRVNRTASSLADSFRQLETETDVEFTESIETIETTRVEILTETTSIVQTEFTETRLSIGTTDERASFTDPLRLTGRLTTANGTALAARSVTIRIGGQTQTVETDADGTFATAYRPTTLPTGDRTVTVRYVPTNASLFVGSSATVSVRVDSVTPTLQVSSTTDRADYNDTVTVTGRVAVDDVGAGAVPVALSVDGVRLGSAVTAPNGSFRVRGRLPATVRSGGQSLTVRIAQTGRALSSVRTSDPITIEATPTRLSIDAEAVNAETVDLSGRVLVESATGDGVPTAVVTVSQNGTALGTLSTDGSGGFATQLAPESADDRTVTLTVAFDGDGTNLGSATASTQVRLPAPADASGTTTTGTDGSAAGATGGAVSWGSLSTTIASTLRSSPLAVGGTLLGLAVLVVAGILAVVRRRDGASDTTDADAGGIDSDDEVSTRPSETEPTDGASSSFISEATERLGAGASEDAVRYAYAGVRTRLGANSGSTAERLDTQTHWEFYETVAPTLSTEQRTALRTLTERFEQAAFTPDGVESGEAERSIETARSLVDAAD